MERTSQAVIARSKELKTYWAPRNEKFKKWYRLIQMVDELKTDKMESFVGNDPRSMYNLVLHMLDSNIPHRLEAYDIGNLELTGVNESVSVFLDKAWKHNQRRFRGSGPRQSLMRSMIGLMLATGWYSVFAIVSDDGTQTFVDPWNPADVFPMWDFFDLGLTELAHIYKVDSASANRMIVRNSWSKVDLRAYREVTVYDYWWIDTESGWPVVWNAVVIGDSGDSLVKFAPTRFKRIPVHVSPVGGLPDIGTLSEGTELSTSTYSAGSVTGERWKEEIGQAIVATNENIYRTWNKWWTYSLQLLRDTAQPRIFERSRSGKAIVKPEDVFRRGAIFRGGPDDSVDFIGAPPVPLEIRSTQLDLEAMMQRGGVSWALMGSLSGQLTAYVMSQIAASANQIMKPFHQAIISMVEDIDNDFIDDIRARGVKPHGWSLPKELTSDMRIVANYEVEIPGELVQKATVARMLDPDFRVSYSYVLNRLFPDIRNPMQERARVNADNAERSPENATIAYISFCRKQAAYLDKIGDGESAKLYEMAAEAALARLQPPQPEPSMQRPPIGNRAEGLPRTTMPTGGAEAPF